MIKIIVIIILILLLILLLYLGFKKIKFNGGYTDVQSYNDYFEGKIKIHQTTVEEFNTQTASLLWGLLKHHSIRANPSTTLDVNDVSNALYNINQYI